LSQSARQALAGRRAKRELQKTKRNSRLAGEMLEKFAKKLKKQGR
jgi:hypothetical protein